MSRHISLTASNACLTVRASRNRSLIQQFGKRASGHPTAKEALPLRFAQPFPDFIPPAPAFPSPRVLPTLQSRKQAPFHLPLIYFTPLQCYICLFPVRIIKIADKIFKRSKNQKRKPKLAVLPANPTLGKMQGQDKCPC